MIKIQPFAYQPLESETERASNSYLMSLVAVMGGLPIPLLNLLATFFFWVANRNSTFFVRWHCIQALLSQVALFFMNSASFWWTISIVFGSGEPTRYYFAYIAVVVLFNITEFITTIYTASKVRKGIHVNWWFFGTLTDMICIKKDKPLFRLPKTEVVNINSMQENE
jgi:hypothetical protein